MDRTTQQETGGQSTEHSSGREIKARLFGDDTSNHLMKQMIKARLLRDLQQPTGGADTCEESELATQPASRELPDEPIRIGRFAVLRKLGHGGMGVVYAAYDEQLDRKVAIKILRGELNQDERGRTRMLREAQALARLSHPNVVHVHEVGSWRDHDYVAMEFIDGETLASWMMSEAERNWREALDILVQAGRGLAEAHRAGLVHRDFKPANVLVGRDGRARVLDFGLARSIGVGTDSVDEIDETFEQTIEDSRAGEDASISGSSAFDDELTATGALMGTPAYMSPEQHLGQPATALSDQFAFCVVLYEALFGRRPFKAETRSEYAVRVTEGEFIVPGPNSGVPAWLRRAVVRGLAPDPQRRWASMDELLAELARDRARNWRRGAFAAGALGLITAGALYLGPSPDSQAAVCEYDRASLGDTWGADQRGELRQAFAATELPYAEVVLEQAEDDLDRYADELLAARGDACSDYRVDHVQDDEDFHLRSACLDQRERELAAAVEVLTRADAEVVRHTGELVSGLGDIALCERVDLLARGTQVPKDEEAVAAIAKLREDIARGHAARRVGRMDEAEAIAEGAVERAEKLGYEPVLGEALYLVGRNAAQQLDYAAAVNTYTQAAAIASLQHNPRLLADTWLDLAWISSEDPRRIGDGIALDMAEAAVDALGSSPDHLVRLSTARGLVLTRAEAFDEARSAFDDAVARADAIESSAGQQLLLDALIARADLHGQTGAPKLAREDLERVLSIQLNRGGPRHPATLDAAHNLAVIEIDAGDYDAAKRHLDAALSGYRELYGAKGDTLAFAELTHARLRLEQGDAPAAVRAAERSVDILGPKHPDLHWALDALASSQMIAEDYDSARGNFELAVDSAKRTHSPTSTRVAYLHSRLGALADERQDHAASLRAYDNALAVYADSELANSSDAGRMMLGRARALAGLGQRAAAIEAYEQAVDLLPLDAAPRHIAGAARLELASALQEEDQRRDERVAWAKQAAECFRDDATNTHAFEQALALSKF